MPNHLPYTALTLTLLICPPTRGQEQPKCDVKFPLSVVLPNGAVLRNMETADFAAFDGKRPVHVVSATASSGPRRIVFVVETGKSLKPVTRTVESDIVSAMREGARPGDAIALISARGSSLEVPFGSAKDAMDSAVRELAQEPRAGSSGRDLLGAAVRAADWLEPHQEGDTVVVVAKGLEEDRKTNYGAVRKRLAEEGIRLFGFQLGPVLVGSVYGGINFGMRGALPTSSTVSNGESLIDLADYTGGLLAEQTVEGNELTAFKLTDERKKAIASMARQHYKAIAEFYLLNLEGPLSNLTVSVSDEVRKSFPKVATVYPRNARTCQASAVSLLSRSEIRR